MPPVRIILVDNQYLSSAGFSRTCTGLEWVSQLTQVYTSEAIKEELEKDPEAILAIDPNSDPDLGLNFLREIKEVYPLLYILVISANMPEEQLFQILKLGIENVLTKDCDQNELTLALRASSEKEKYFDKTVLNLIVNKQFTDNPKNPVNNPDLTNRELEVLRLIALGKSTKEIAGDLIVSPHTVYTHRKNIMRKLGVNNGSELILYAVRSGLIDPI